jgi:hypothetical protein
MSVSTNFDTASKQIFNHPTPNRLALSKSTAFGKILLGAVAQSQN